MDGPLQISSTFQNLIRIWLKLFAEDSYLKNTEIRLDKDTKIPVSLSILDTVGIHSVLRELCK